MTAPTEVTEKVYTDTVAVLPGYARAVATELRAPSERWHQYQEPPTNYFDDTFGGLAYMMSPAVREAYQDESVLGRALKVLNRYTHAPCDTACIMQPSPSTAGRCGSPALEMPSSGTQAKQDTVQDDAAACLSLPPPQIEPFKVIPSTSAGHQSSSDAALLCCLPLHGRKGACTVWSDASPTW